MWSDIDSEVLTAAEADPVQTFASQVLTPKFHISYTEKVKAAATVFKEKRAALLANKVASV